MIRCEIWRPVRLRAIPGIAVLGTALLLSGHAAAQQSVTVSLIPSRDNTIFSEDAEKSNGRGVHLFFGNTGVAGIRRALLRFDLSGIPAGSTVTSASLRIVVNTTLSGGNPASIHRLNADWGEGASDAGFSRDGGGTQAEPGDATWAQRFFGNASSAWTSQGGDFVASPSATINVDGIGTYQWSSTSALVADVQGWVNAPSANFGWMIRGDETTTVNGVPVPATRTAKRIYSTQGAIVTSQAELPTLTVTYTPPSGPGGGTARSVPLPGWALLGLAGVIAVAARRRFGRASEQRH